MIVQKSTLPFSATGQFPKLFLDYISGRTELRSFYSYTPLVASFKDGIVDLSKRSFDRALLVDVLQKQYASTHKCIIPATVSSLLNENTFTVTTGHQLCLFTGPLYFIYKIISVINLAEELKKKYPENDFVPVYWMASEDHDFEEVNHVSLFGKKVEWKTEQKGAVGRFDTNSLKTVIDELASILGESEKAKELVTLFENAYLQNKNLANATRTLVNELFSSYGLIVVDGDDARLKKAFTDVLKDDISNQTNFKLVNESISKLETLGYKAQVNPREINVFLLSANERKRIEKVPGANELSELLKDPSKLSPNVVLRPLYQQKILPNIAYVGGPGEISYWLEYKAMFDQQKIFFPALIPRSSVMFVDKKGVEQLAKNGLGFSDLFNETEVMLKRIIELSAGASVSLGAEEEKLAAVYKEIAEKTQAVDKTLKAASEAELQKAINGLKNLESKMLKAEKQKQESGLNQARKLKEKLFPGGVLQERHDNFMSLYLTYGKEFFTMLKENLDPLQLEFIIISE